MVHRNPPSQDSLLVVNCCEASRCSSSRSLLELGLELPTLLVANLVSPDEIESAAPMTLTNAEPSVYFFATELDDASPPSGSAR